MPIIYLNRTKLSIISLLLLFFFQFANGQSYTAAQLSAVVYGPLQDSLSKAWKCPKIFQAKNTQKEFAQNWENRKAHLLKAIKNNDFVRDTIIHPYISALLAELTAANPGMITQPVHLFLDRTVVPNAYALGDHFIAINAGLIMQARDREELALYLAHELAHDLLAHADQAMKKRAELITSEEYKASLNDVLSSRYQRFSRLKKVMESYSFDRSRHSRYNEQEADSLAIILIKNSSISFDAAYFLRLDSVDGQYRRPLLQPAKDHFTAFGLTPEDPQPKTRPKGLSAHNFNFNSADSSHTADSLKTHPDCEERYRHNLSANSTPLVHTPIPAAVRQQAVHIALYDMWMNQNLGHAFYRLFQDNEQQAQPKGHAFLVGNLMYSLLHAVQTMDRFNSLRIEKKEEVSSSYFELQTMLERAPEATLVRYCQELDQQFTSQQPEQAAFRSFCARLAAPPTEERAAKLKAAALAFKNSYPNSCLTEYTNQFIR